MLRCSVLRYAAPSTRQVLTLKTLALMLTVAALSQGVFAATFNHGNKSAAPFDFLNIEEDSSTESVAIFGAPTAISLSPDVRLDFNPTGFIADASVSDDVASGRVTFTLMDDGGPQTFGFRQITISEFGDFTLGGTGTLLTTVQNSATANVTVKEINGSPVAPFLVQEAANVGFNLNDNRGTLRAWTREFIVDLGPALTSRGFGASAVVTKADVAVNNSLRANRETGSAASIAKKDLVVTVRPVQAPVPEFRTVALLAVACGAALGFRRR